MDRLAAPAYIRARTMEFVMSDASAADLQTSSLADLVVQLLEWVQARPRTYAEAMDAWRTSCPRMPVWEEALSERLIALGPPGGCGMAQRQVSLTDLGRRRLGCA
jgi:hypothetical protein